MTRAQASLLALSVSFRREQASLMFEFRVMKRFFASKTDAHLQARMLALQSYLALFIGDL